MKNVLYLAVLLFVNLSLFAQTETPYGAANDESLPLWTRLMYAENPDPDLVIDAFHSYYKERDFVKNGHTQYLKRWLRELDTYEYQFIDPSITQEQKNELRRLERQYLQQSNQGNARSSNWIPIGPTDWDHDAGGRSYAPGAAHIYTIEQCAGNSNIMYAGTATAGLWKSTNHGGSWTNVTKDLVVNQVYAVESSPSNCNEVYGAMFNSIYKSTDGGSTWNATGDAAFQAISMKVKDIKFAPGGGTLWAATDAGLYQSTNNGSSWSQTLSGSIQEIEFHPTTSSTMYIIRQTGVVTEFHKSTNSGGSFAQQTMGWPAPIAPDENLRAEIAVTPASPDKVYALLTGSVNGGSGLYGVYVSADAGASWTFNCCGSQPGGPASSSNINTMGWSDAGTDGGGQYYYDVGFAVSPTDANKVFLGGVNLWVSDDGGNTFTCPSKWSHPHKPNYVHADIHDINFYSTGDLWLGCDGGIFHSPDSGANFTRSMNGISGSDFWGFGMGYNNEELMLGGAYHNGTLIKNGSVYDSDWACIDGGDGVGGAVNPILENQVYSDRNIKTMPNDRTIAPSARGYALEPSWTYVAGKFNQIEFGPDSYNEHFFASGSSLYKTEDDNRSVSQIHDFGEEITDVEVAWTNDQVIYVTTWSGHWDPKKLYRSSNGGLNWTEITPSAISGSSIPLDVEVSYQNEDIIWLARVGRQTNNNNKIYRSSDGGTNWTNISGTSLSGEILTNVIAQRGNDDLYLGTTRTVYYSNSGQGSWQLFNSGLPASARSRQLAIGYRSSKLVNATNRSVWSSNLERSSPVIAKMSVDKTYSGCARDTFKFADYSTVPISGTTYSWSFPGASWVSSTTARNPRVIFGENGNFSASLTVTSSSGSDTQIKTNFITVGNECSPDNFAGSAMLTSTNSQHFRSTNELEVSTNTMTLMCWIKPDGIQDSYTGLIFNDDTSSGLNLRNNNEIGYHWAGGSTHWSWSSGLNAPADEWSFVVLVLEPNKITVHLNDQKVERTLGTAIAPVYWSTFRIGRYQGWSSRNFKGYIDEVLIWNRALSTEEVRDWRHLTKHQQATPSDGLFDDKLLTYIQFNDSGSTIYDRVGSSHGILNGSAVLAGSSVPVGQGTSSRMIVNAAGTYNFSNEKLKLIFPTAGTYPNADLVVTRLFSLPPGGHPSDVFDANYYWIVNNYGNNSFTELTSLEFTGLNGVNASNASNPEQFTLYKRPSNSDLSTWGSYIDQADAAQAGGLINFSTNNSVTGFSQFSIGQNASLLPLEFVDLWLEKTNESNVMVHWKTDLEENVSHFIIEKSHDGRQFEEINRTSANNNIEGEHYRILDQKPLRGLNFYRIQAVDFSGEVNISPIHNIYIEQGGIFASAYPNPVGKGGVINLSANTEENAIFELYAMNGRLLRRTMFQQTGILRLPSLAAEVYTYRIHSQGQVLKEGKLIK